MQNMFSAGEIKNCIFSNFVNFRFYKSYALGLQGGGAR